LKLSFALKRSFLPNLIRFKRYFDSNCRSSNLTKIVAIAVPVRATGTLRVARMVTAAVTFSAGRPKPAHLETETSPCAAKTGAIAADWALVLAPSGVRAVPFSFRLSGTS
jgi:hypothetical protein